MTITIKIDTGNAAFEGENRDDEIERIVREWLRQGVRPAGLMDYNGNRVGAVTVKGK